MPNTVATAYDFAVELLNVAYVALGTTVGGTIDRAFVSPGIPSIDCEMLSVTPISLNLDGAGAGGPLSGGRKLLRGGRINQLGFAITVARECIPVVANGNDLLPPSPVQMNTAAQITTEDVWAIWHAIGVAANADTLFEGRCSLMYLDNAVALTTQGMTAGWLISLRTEIDGY